MMIIKILLCLAFSLFNNYTDWKSYKIRNKAVILFSAAGVGFNLFSLGRAGAISSVFGGGIMLCLFPLFALRMLGAGDVKALMGIGFMLGFPLSVYALIYSILGGGILALLALIFRKNAKTRFKYFFSYLKVCIKTWSLQPYTLEMDSADKGNFRFSFGITVGMLALLFKEIL